MKRILKIFFLCTALPVCSLSAESLTQYVNPMIGTDGYGNVYPGAQIPFGVLAFSNTYGEMIFFLRLACF